MVTSLKSRRLEWLFRTNNLDIVFAKLSFIGSSIFVEFFRRFDQSFGFIA